MQTSLPVKPAAPQGADAIVIRAPHALVWRLIADSTALVRWGPPVRQVIVSGQPEQLGSMRTVVAEMTRGGTAITADRSATARDKKIARFVERRIEHVEGRKIGYRIEEDNMGLSRLITEVGLTMEIEPLGENETRLVWTFHHNPRGILGALMNRFFVRPQQRRNRLAALTALKRYAEMEGIAAHGP
jgi:ligand-binding SRPBCC domain-containing protein